MESFCGEQQGKKPVETDEIRAWKNFEISGKVTDYLSYSQVVHGQTTLEHPDEKPAEWL